MRKSILETLGVVGLAAAALGLSAEGAFAQNSLHDGIGNTGQYSVPVTSKGSQAKGSQVKGSQVKGSQVKGSQMKGGQAKGAQVKGSQMKGGQAKGSQIKGGQAY